MRLQGKERPLRRSTNLTVLFQLIANMASIDRKIKFRIPPKTSVALKFLREQLGNVLAHQFRHKTLMQSHLQWNETGLMVLGKVKPEGKS